MPFESTLKERATMINKPLENITEADLQDLIINPTPEKRHLEYKRELPSDASDSKIKFLAQLSSLANTDGGDILLGVEEDRAKGIPKELSGIEMTNPDQEIQRLDQIVQSGISPRIIAHFVSIRLDNGKYVIVGRVPASWRSPHRVVLAGHNNFYARDSAGKHPMDVDELRSAFLFSASASRQLNDFRDERVFAIQRDDTPERLGSTARTILHMIPLVSLSRPFDLDIKAIMSSPKHHYSLDPIGHSADSRRYNYEGYFTYVPSSPGRAHAYFQLFRNGIIESVEADLFETDIQDRKVICEALLEGGILESLRKYLTLYHDFEIPPPVFVCLTLLGFKDHSLPRVRGTLPFDLNQKMGRDVLRFPERIIEDFEESADSIMKPIFNALWNAGGYSEDLYYGEDGTWKNPKNQVLF